MGSISLEAAIQAHEQSTRDLAAALDSTMALDPVAMSLALTTALDALAYPNTVGWTPEARRKNATARRVVRAALGIEDEA